MSIKVYGDWCLSPKEAITVELRDENFILFSPLITDGKWKHGHSDNGQFVLSIEDAKQLVRELLCEIDKVETTERECQEYFKREKK